MKCFLLPLLLLAAPLRAAELQLDHSQGPSLSGQALAFSPDAKKLAVAGSEGVKIYECATGKVLETRAGGGIETSSVAWSPDGKALAAGGLGFGPKSMGEIWVWREGHKPLHWVTGNALVGSLAWSPNGKTLGSASADDFDGERAEGSAALWDASSGKLLHTLGRYKANNAAVAFTSDGKKVAYSSANGSTEQLMTTLCDANTGNVLKQWPDAAMPLILDKEQPLFKNALLARTVKQGVEWRIQQIDGADHMNYQFVARRLGAKRNLTTTDLGTGSGCATFGGDYLATIMLKYFFPGDESSVAIWKITGNPPRAKLVQRLGMRTLSPLKLGRSVDGRTLTLATNQGTALLDSQLTKLRILPKYPGQNVFSEVAPSLSSDGKTVFDGRWIKLHSLQRSALTPQQSLDAFHFSNSVLSPDGRAVAGPPGVMELGRAGKKATKFSIPFHRGDLFVQSASWAPDSNRVAVLGKATQDGQLFLFDRTGKFQREILKPDEIILFSAAAFSPDGKWLLTAGATNLPNQRLDLWDASTGAHRKQFTIGLQAVPTFGGEGITTVAFSPDGRTVVASGALREYGIAAPRAVFFDASSGKKVGDLSIPLKVQKPWVFLDTHRIAMIQGNAIEVWDFRTHKRQKSVFLVPNGSKVEIVTQLK